MLQGADKRKVSHDLKHWLLAIMITVGGVLVWSLLLTPTEVAGHAPAREYPRIGYRPVIVQGNDAGEMSDELQAVWSPVLFSLPTHMGFSKHLLAHKDRMLPPAVLPKDSFLLRTEPVQFSRSASALRTVDVKHHVRERSRKRIRERGMDTSVFGPGADATRKGVGNIQWLGGLSEDDLLAGSVDVPETSNVVDGVFAVSIGSNGFVDHVFVERGSPDTVWNDAVVRMLKQWRTKASGEVRQERVLVQHGTYGVSVQQDAWKEVAE